MPRRHAKCTCVTSCLVHCSIQDVSVVRRIVTLPRGVTPEPGQRDTPTDLGAAKVTGAVGNVRYGVLAAVEDDISWRGRDGDDLAVDIEAPGRDFAVARLVYEDVGDSQSLAIWVLFLAARNTIRWYTVWMRTTVLALVISKLTFS